MTLAPSHPETTSWWQPLMSPRATWVTTTSRDLADRIHAVSSGGDASALERASSASVVEALVHQAVKAVVPSGGPDPSSVDALPPELEAAIDLHVQSGAELTDVMHSFRLLQELLGEALLERVEQPGRSAGVAAEMRRVSRLFTAHMNVVALLIVDRYRRTDRAWRERANRRRDLTVAALLAGEEVDPVEAGHALGHPVLRRHLALVVRTASPTAPDDVAGWLRAAEAPRALVVPRGLAWWVWIAAREPEELLVRLRATAPPGIHAGAGTPASGPGGFRSSHLEADAAVRLAVRRHEALVCFRDVELDLLLGADERAAEAFVRRELGDLGGPDPFLADLRRTLRIYLAEGRSVGRAAARLHVARNTVSYRVKRASEILGRGPDERRLELECALRIAEDGVGPARP